MKRDVVTFVVVALAIAVSSPAGSAEPLSLREAETLPPEVVSQRVMDQLADVLVVDSRPPPLAPRVGFSLVSKPRPTSVHGFCRVDFLRPEFDPPLGNGPTLDRGGRAVGFRAGQMFAYVGDPSAGGRDCSKLDPLGGAFFVAQSEWLAEGGYDLLGRAISSAESGRFPVTCDRDSLWERPSSCSSALAGIKLGQLGSIEACQLEVSRPSDACYIYSVGSFIVHIVGRRGDREQAVVRVKLEPMPVF